MISIFGLLNISRSSVSSIMKTWNNFEFDTFLYRDCVRVTRTYVAYPFISMWKMKYARDEQEMTKLRGKA